MKTKRSTMKPLPKDPEPGTKDFGLRARLRRERLLRSSAEEPSPAYRRLGRVRTRAERAGGKRRGY